MAVRDINVEGKKVLVRVDFNVPLDEKAKKITNDSRIQAALPTIKYLIGQKARVILCSHLGRPDGNVVEQLRLAPIGQRLSQILQQPIAITRDCLGSDVEKAVRELGVGEILLLENVRFHPGEEENDGAFAQALARLADVYVDEAFGAVHRRHASIVGVANYLPAVAGLLLEKEIKTLGGILKNPAHPFVVLMGGAKVGDKLSLIENIRDRVDSLLIGGGMAATLLKAKSCEVGLSLVENDKLTFGVKLMEDISRQGAQLLLPVDVVVAHDPSDDVKTKVVSIENIPSDSRIVDIGPLTIRNFSRELERCKTVFWNGPLGIHEVPQFAKGTQILAELLSSLKAKTVIGGGSTVEVVTKMKLADKMTFVSTGGGASLRFLSGKTLPGIEVLMDKGA